MNKIKWLIFIFIGLVSASGLVNAAAPASLGAGDTVSIWVKGEPELSVERQVGRDGSIIMPLIGSVGVSGMKTNDAARLISQMLEDGYLKDPLVQVTLKGKGSKKPLPAVLHGICSVPIMCLESTQTVSFLLKSSMRVPEPGCRCRHDAWQQDLSVEPPWPDPS